MVVLQHTGEQPYACPHCDKRFKVSSGVGAHIRRSHPELVEGGVDVAEQGDDHAIDDHDDDDDDVDDRRDTAVDEGVASGNAAARFDGTNRSSGGGGGGGVGGLGSGDGVADAPVFVV